jgi:hypothetical protein
VRCDRCDAGSVFRFMNANPCHQLSSPLSLHRALFRTSKDNHHRDPQRSVREYSGAPCLCKQNAGLYQDAAKLLAAIPRVIRGLRTPIVRGVSEMIRAQLLRIAQWPTHIIQPRITFRSHLKAFFNSADHGSKVYSSGIFIFCRI